MLPVKQRSAPQMDGGNTCTTESPTAPVRADAPLCLTCLAVLDMSPMCSCARTPLSQPPTPVRRTMQACKRPREQEYELCPSEEMARDQGGAEQHATVHSASGSSPHHSAREAALLPSSHASRGQGEGQVHEERSVTSQLDLGDSDDSPLLKLSRRVTCVSHNTSNTAGSRVVASSLVLREPRDGGSTAMHAQLPPWSPSSIVPSPSPPSLVDNTGSGGATSRSSPLPYLRPEDGDADRARLSHR